MWHRSDETFAKGEANYWTESMDGEIWRDIKHPTLSLASPKGIRDAPHLQWARIRQESFDHKPHKPIAKWLKQKR